MEGKEIYKHQRLCMVTYMLLSLIDMVCIFLGAKYLASFVGIFVDFSYEKGKMITVRLGIVLAIQLLCAYIKNRYWIPHREMAANKLECAVYRRYFEALPDLESESKMSVICSRDIPECTAFLTEKVPAAVQAAAGVAVYSFFLIRKQGGIWVTALLFALGLIQFIPPFVTKKYLIQNYIRAGQEEERVRQELIAGLSGILTIKMLNLQDWFLNRYRKRQQEFRKAGERAAETSSIQSALHSGALLIQQLGFLLLGVIVVAKGALSLEVLVEGYALSVPFYQYMARLGNLKAERGTYKAAAGRINQMFEETKAESLFFDDLEMELPEKGLWLIKGENGAGKSTLLAVLSGCRRSNAKIRLDGGLMERESRLAKTGLCPQRYLKLMDSFQELVETIPAELMDAAFLQECLARLDIVPETINRPLESLSGGQQKKLVLALAFAKRGSLLLLDEPEVSLDQAGIACLRRLLEHEERPVLLVTHVSDFDDLAAGTIYVEGGKAHVQAG